MTYFRCCFLYFYIFYLWWWWFWSLNLFFFLMELMESNTRWNNIQPRCSMYGIFTYIWLKFMVNVGRYSSPMEHMGNIVKKSSRTFWQWKIGCRKSMNIHGNFPEHVASCRPAFVFSCVSPKLGRRVLFVFFVGKKRPRGFCSSWWWFLTYIYTVYIIYYIYVVMFTLIRFVLRIFLC